MPTTRYRGDGVTITLTGDLESYVRKVIDGAGGEMLRMMEAEAEKVAAEARRQWYGLVEKETGQSGTIDVVTTVDTTRGTFRVAVGSTDTRTGKNGKPSVVYVHAPGANSLVRVQVTPAEYWATPENQRSSFGPLPENKRYGLPADPPGSGPFVFKNNPKAGNGKGLLQGLIKSPMKAKVKELAPQIAASVANKIKAVR